MVNSASPTPSHRTQRALSMAAETRKSRDPFHLSGDYPYTHQPFHYPPNPIPSPFFDAYHPPTSPESPTLSSPSSASSPSPSPTKSSIATAYNNAQDATVCLFGSQDPFNRGVPTTTPEQRKEAKEAKIAQRQRREQIILMLQQQQIEAQEKAKQDKLDRQQAKLERKQKRAEFKDMQIQAQMRREQGPLSALPDIQYQPSQLYHLDQASTHSSSSSTSTSPRNSSPNPDRMRSLSLKSNTKSMYDLRPWSGSGVPHSPTYDLYSGYESDEASGSHGWDSLMDTLHSPTMTTMTHPSDTLSWDLKDDHGLELADSLDSMSLGDSGNGNGNGKYLLILGANGRTGLELVKQGLERNYRVTAFVRDDKLLLEDSALRKNQNLLIVRGSPTSQSDLDRCVESQDVIINVIGARLMTGDSTISSHSQVVLNNAMKKHGVRRLIVVTSYGCLGLRNNLINTRKLFSRMFMTGILKDKALQEDIIQRDAADLDWTIVRPITLKDGDLSKKYVVSSCELPKTDKVKVLTRKDLVHYLLSIINRRDEFGAIRSIAGKPKTTKPSTLSPLERKELARQQKDHQAIDLSTVACDKRLL
ncbi:hypothetical protein BGZ74_002281 [Mortierella antarctica]|nr:hypothetical protein BGZ74_002281 [Mortierella antarctica]